MPKKITQEQIQTALKKHLERIPDEGDKVRFTNLFTGAALDGAQSIQEALDWATELMGSAILPKALDEKPRTLADWEQIGETRDGGDQTFLVSGNPATGWSLQYNDQGFFIPRPANYDRIWHWVWQYVQSLTDLPAVSAETDAYFEQPIEDIATEFDKINTEYGTTHAVAFVGLHMVDTMSIQTTPEDAAIFRRFVTLLKKRIPQL